MPLGPVMDYTGERPVEELELVMFPGNAEHAEFEYYDDDGISFNYRSGEYSVTRISMDRNASGWLISIAPDERSAVKEWSIRIGLPGKPSAILHEGVPLAGEYDAARGELTLKVIKAGIVEIRR